MSAEAAVSSIVEEVCSKPTLTPEAVLKLRNAGRNNLAERKLLESRFAGLETENLQREEKTLRQAAFAWILHRFDPAETALKDLSGPFAHLIKGAVLAEKGHADQAVPLLRQAAEQFASSPIVLVEVAAGLRQAGKFDEALAILAEAEKKGLNHAELFFQRGYALEAQGYQEQSCSAYEKAIELDPTHAEAAFRLAYYLDLRGEDQKAIDLYKKVTGQGPAFISAMTNLALLLEDREDYDGAIHCLKEVLHLDPGNRRASLYLRDTVASLDMYYDENERKETERLEAVLRIPISDFELSVRSRNCLAKMGVRTLGELVRKSEQELLAYKNFGETSLSEIKNLLASKGLRLGMFREEEAKRARAQRMKTGGVENPHLIKPITDLELSVRARKCMQRLNIESVGDLVDKSEADLLATKNFGQTSLNEIKLKLGELGLGLKASE